ncbi:unnamed protein product [Choristocarpus tenellus]
MVAIHSINYDNRSFTVRQVTMKMVAKGLNYNTSAINRWLDDMGAMPNHRWIKPKLKSWQKVWRMDFICDQVDKDDSDLPGSPITQHKSHIHKTVIIAANAHPDSTHSFDGKLSF